MKEQITQISGKNIPGSQCKIPVVGARLVHLKKSREGFADGIE